METKIHHGNDEFLRLVNELSGQNVFECYQCGKCSAGCPVADSMDMLPSQVIRFVQMNDSEAALNSKTIWLCASCHTCETRCPKGVDLAKVMEALRVIVLREKGRYMKDPVTSELSKLPQQALVSGSRKYTD